MKYRYGFVSNSSSSSYIVISKGTAKQKDIPEKAFNEKGELPIPNDFGNYSFGWDTKWYGSTLDRINFAFCQLMYLCDENFPPKEGEAYELFLMFEEVLKEEGITPKYIILKKDAKEEGQWLCAMDYDFYIDHQSSAIEGVNIEMFDSKESLHDFLFNEGSGIQGGNDN